MDDPFKRVIEEFAAETEDNLASMEEALLGLEANPADLAPIDLLFRLVHNLKGNATVLGFADLADFVHRLEDGLEPIRDQLVQVSDGLVSIFLEAVDYLRVLVSCAMDNRPCDIGEGERILASLTESAASGQALATSVEKGSAAVLSAVKATESRTAMARVHIDKLDRLMNFATEITVSRGQMRQLLQTVTGHLREELIEAHREADVLFLDMQEQIMKLRMVSLGPTFRQYSRMVRDIATTTGKPSDLVIEGEDVEVDLSIVEHIKDPLTHLIRNAIDHGIESAALRAASGKPARGKVLLRAGHEGGSIFIQVADDGSGLQRDRILARAVAHGLVADDAVLTDEEIYLLIFEPGFSTAAMVSELSGRGVGLDVVKRNVELLRGSIEIESPPEGGTAITMRLPLTLAIIEGFAIEAGGESYIVPLDTVAECLELPAELQRDEKLYDFIDIRGHALPLIRLRKVFDGQPQTQATESILVVQQGSQRAGLVVDRLEGEMQAVIKPLGYLFKKQSRFSASTIFGDGRVALVLDVGSLLKEALNAQNNSHILN
jgi:two-component system, chemotaxis family, sensor kinase CheA